MNQLAQPKLKPEDIRILVRHPDAEHRARAAQRICRTVRQGRLSDAERVFAKRLLAHMAHDAVAIVRRALAVTLKNSPHLPRDVAMTLAQDIDNIAVPVIENSPVLTDLDLVEVLKSKAAAKVLAVAKRPTVSGDLVRAIIRYGDSYAVAELAANDGARIDGETASQMLALYHDNDLLKNAFIARRDLPVSIMEKLITMVSEEAAILLNERHDLPLTVAMDIAQRSRERSVLSLTDRDLSETDTRLLAQRLFQEARLTPSMLIRTAGYGRMNLLKHAMALKAGINPGKAALMIHDSGPLGLQALCQAAGLDGIQTKIIRAACAIFRDLELASVEYDPAYFQKMMVERMLTLPFELSEDDETWFLERFDALSENAA